MNPSIHHPAWYEAVQIITKEEREAAVAETPLPAGPIVIPQTFARFQFGNTTVTCQPDRWEIQTTDSRLDRIVHFAKRTFQVLGETHLVAFGINFQVHRRLANKNILSTLSERLRAVRVGFRETWNVSSVVQTTQFSPGTTVTATIKSILGKPEFVGVALAYHTSINLVVKKEGKFDIGPYLDSAAVDQAKHATAFVQMAVEDLVS